MKRIATLMMLFCIVVLSAKAQLLWKVSGKDLPKASYILGTHHLAPLSILDSIAGFKQAMNNVEQVCGEIIMAEMQAPATIQKIQQTVMMPGDTTLRTLYTVAQYDTLSVKIKRLIGVDLIDLMNMVKPSFITTQLSVVIATKAIPGFNPKQQLDSWFQTEAQKQGKEVTALETIDFQINMLFDSQSLQRQAEQLLATVNHLEDMEQQARKMTEAYMAQDLKKLEAAMNKKFGTAVDALPEEEDALIYNRNRKWAESMPNIMNSQPTLFAVGCGHLMGKRGILNLLKRQGYSVTPVK
jgi:uncharacterized protein YbaP (TraB family)